MAALLSYWTASGITTPLLFLIRRIRKFPEISTYYFTDSKIQEIDKLYEIAEEFMADMKEQIKDLGLEKELLSSLLNNLREGVLCLNSEGIIIFHNGSVATELVESDSTGKPYFKAVRHPVMLECIRKKVQEQDLLEQLSAQKLREERSPEDGSAMQPIAFHQDKKYFKMTCYPIVMEDRLELFLIIIHDDTREHNTKRLRQDFLQNASHELKTPITSIRGYAETMLYKLENERDRGFTTAILRNVGRMERIIEDMVTISSLESGAFPFNPEKMDVHMFLIEVRELVVGTLNQKHQELIMNLDLDNTELIADPLLMEHLLLNLIVNASRYSPENTTIYVDAFPDSNSYIFSVSDEGPGIEEENKVKIFERFFRADKNRSRDQGGTGLGLSIVRQITRIHGGKVWVENRLEGGAIFKVSLPVSSV